MKKFILFLVLLLFNVADASPPPTQSDDATQSIVQTVVITQVADVAQLEISYKLYPNFKAVATVYEPQPRKIYSNVETERAEKPPTLFYRQGFKFNNAYSFSKSIKRSIKGKWVWFRATI